MGRFPLQLKPVQGALALLVGTAIGASGLLSPLLPPIITLAAVFAALLAWLPVRPIHALYALIVLIPFSAALPRGQFLPFLVPGEAALLLTAILTVIYVALARNENRIPPRLLIGAAVFGIGTAILPVASYMARGIELPAPDLLNLMAPLQYLVLFWICANVPRAEEERRGLVQVMILTGSCIALIGLLQAAEVGPVVGWLQSWYPSPQGVAAQEIGRVTSVFGAWNALGLFLVTTLLLIAGTFPDEDRPLYRSNMRVATVFALVCLLATNLWSGLIGSAIGFVYIKWMDPRELKSLVPITIVFAIGALALLPDIAQRFAFQARADTWVPETLVFRWGVWQDIFVPRIAESPLFGVRPSFAGLAWPHPESQYIGYLYRSGAVALVAHVIWLALTASWLYGSLWRGGLEAVQRNLGLTALSLVLVLSLIGIINPVFTYSGTMEYFWITLGIVVSGGTMTRDDTT